MNNSKYQQEFNKSNLQNAQKKGAQGRNADEHSAVQDKRANANRNEEGVGNTNKQNQAGQSGQYPTRRGFDDEE